LIFQLIFHGGITAARGHAGMNAGRAALEQFALSGIGGRASTPVFGCPLSEPRYLSTTKPCRQ
jgi:hypothetical protein